MAKILLVEDEADLSGPISDTLTREKHVVEVIANGDEALECLRLYQYDLIILDWMLPGASGLDICRKFRSNKGTTPILMLTARAALEDKEAGLDCGADDYLTKPFHLRELVARVRAILRRPAQTPGTIITVGYLTLDPLAKTVTKNDKPLHLLPKEYALLEFFMRHNNQVFSAEALVDRVWPSDSLMLPDTVRTYIKNLRKKIDLPNVPSMISTVHGMGYKLEAP
jgi:two-component system, OmpR family, manganese sensing response regulator